MRSIQASFEGEVVRIIIPAGITARIDSTRPAHRRKTRFRTGNNRSSIVRRIISGIIKLRIERIRVIEAVPVVIAVPWAVQAGVVVTKIIRHGIVIVTRPPAAVGYAES